MPAVEGNNATPTNAAAAANPPASHNISKNGWFIVIGVVAAALAYWPAWSSLHHRWRDWTEFYSHGYALLGIAIFNFVMARNQLLANSARCSYVPLVVLLAVVLQLLWYVAWLAQIEIIQQLLLLPLLFLCTVLMLGWRAALFTALPLALLALAIPVWDYAIPVLQRMATLATAVVLYIAHVPNHIEGNFIHLPGGVVEIAGGCSGLSFFLVSTALGLLYCHQNRLALSSTLKVVVISALVGIAANWLRVSSLALIGNYTTMRHPLMKEHFYYGWIIFFSFFVLMLLLLKKVPLKTASFNTITSPQPLGWRRIMGAVGVVAVAPAGVVLTLLLSAPTIQPATAVIDARAGALQWQRSAESARWKHGFKEPDGDLRWRSDTWPGISFEIVRYAKQRSGRKLISSANAVFDDERWTIEKQTTDSQGVTAILHSRDGKRLLVRYWYDIGGRSVSQLNGARREQIAAALHGRRDAAWLALSVWCDADCSRQQILLERAHNPAGELYRQLFRK